MSKLISEEIVEAITLGDKEGFMSAFQSALAAKVSDALEIKKVEIASTLIAPASSEVVEEEVEQIDEAKHSYEPKIHPNGEHEDPDTHPANGKPDAIVDIEDGRKALIFHNYDFKKGVVPGGKHTYVRKTDGDDDYVYHNHPKVPAEKVKQDFTNLDEEVESIEEGTPEAKGQSRLAWRKDTAEVIAKNHAKIAAKKKAAQKKLLSGKGK